MKKLKKVVYEDEEGKTSREDSKEIVSVVPVRLWEGFTKEITFELVLNGEEFTKE